MGDEVVIVPSDGDGYVSLAKTKTGQLFKKHLLNFGNLRHPETGKQIKIDQKFFDTMKKNFDNGVCDIVQVPIANARNEHTEDPRDNIGEVVDLNAENGKIYATLDIRDPEHAKRMGKTYLGASAMMHLDYTDTKTGQRVGPTLLHSCVTNRPYVTGLDAYEGVLAATADKAQGAVLLTDDSDVVEPEGVVKENQMGDAKPQETEAAKPSLEDLLTALKNDHNIDVSALQAQAADNGKTAELSNTIVKALTDAGVVQLSNNDGGVSTETVVKAVSEVAEKNVALSSRVQGLEKQAAENAVDSLIKTGHVTPAKRDFYVELKLSNPAIFDQVIPDKPVVELNNESGKTPPKDDSHVKDVDAEIARLSNILSAK